MRVAVRADPAGDHRAYAQHRVDPGDNLTGPDPQCRRLRQGSRSLPQLGGIVPVAYAERLEGHVVAPWPDPEAVPARARRPGQEPEANAAGGRRDHAYPRERVPRPAGHAAGNMRDLARQVWRLDSRA